MEHATDDLAAVAAEAVKAGGEYLRGRSETVVSTANSAVSMSRPLPTASRKPESKR
ncbi:hypothetical protein [Halonotius sp. GCM10025705]|uniref:hypothetical protein n=1 Tax=Halonotius sp. GCM10025705 TaxID=3252678 RepID=UPI0036106F1A